MAETPKATSGGRLIAQIPASAMTALDRFRQQHQLSREAAITALVKEALEQRGLPANPPGLRRPAPACGWEIQLPFSKDQTPNAKRYCESGIRLETVRTYIQAEMRTSPEFVGTLFHAADLPRPAVVQQFRAGPGHRSELIVDALGSDGERIKLIVGCTVADPYYWRRTFFGSQLVNDNRKGLKVGLIMLAPRIVFEVSWLETPELWTFEYLMAAASPLLQDVLGEAVFRANGMLRQATSGQMKWGILMARLHGGL